MKMKFFLLAAMIFAGVSASYAQETTMWIGGSVGVWSSKVKGHDGTLSYKLEPEFGYVLNDHFSLVGSLGVMHSENSGLASLGTLDAGGNEADGFTIGASVRYSFLKGQFGYLFLDGGVNFSRLKYDSSDIKESRVMVGIIPGVAIRATKRITLNAALGALGYSRYKRGSKTLSDFGLNLDLDTFELGFNYTF